LLGQQILKENGFTVCPRLPNFPRQIVDNARDTSSAFPGTPDIISIRIVVRWNLKNLGLQGNPARVIDSV